MNAIGIELCDAGLLAATAGEKGSVLVEVAGGDATLGWPGLVGAMEGGYVFAREAEQALFLQPRNVCQLAWEKLSLEAADIHVPGAAPSYSELAFFSLREFWRRLTAKTGAPERLVLAVPGAYLKDATTEELKIGLLLGMAGELRLPLVRIVDLACAAAAGAVAREVPRGLAVVHLDLHSQSAELALLEQDDRLVRRQHLHVPQAGLGSLLRHLKSTMGNRFLRETAFDIHEDRRLEQVFYDQTRAFLCGDRLTTHEYLYQINTARRSYQMAVTRAQLAADLQECEQTLVQNARRMLDSVQRAPGSCVVTLTDRAARLDGLAARLREAGFLRVLRLRPGAAALEAAHLAAESATVADLADVPVATAVPLRLRTSAAQVQAVLNKAPASPDRPAPSHVIVDGRGHMIGPDGLTLGTARSGTAVDVDLPSGFDAAGDFVLRLVRDERGVAYETPAGASTGDAPGRIPLDAGDRLTLCGGGAETELLFAHCSAPAPRR